MTVIPYQCNRAAILGSEVDKETKLIALLSFQFVAGAGPIVPSTTNSYIVLQKHGDFPGFLWLSRVISK